MRKAKTVEQFICEANIIHNDRFDYTKFLYVNNYTKGIIICKLHGEFLQDPNHHLAGRRCPKCGGNILKTVEQFIMESNLVHNNQYDYSKFIYINALTCGIIICLKHGDFKQKPNNHLDGQGCPQCYGNLLRTKNEFIELSNEVHNNKYDYSKFNYINSRVKGIIICPEHDEFRQAPAQHLCEKHGCPKCKLKNQSYVDDFLKNKKYMFETNYYINIGGKKLFADFYISTLNLIIEYNGAQHYRPVTFNSMPMEQAELNFIKQQKRDESLREHCKQNSINLLEIDGRIYQGPALKEYLSKLNLEELIYNAA